MINMPRALMDKVGSMQEQRGNASKEMKMIRNSLKEKLEIKKKKPVIEIKNISEFINRLDMTEARSYEPEDVSITFF